MPRREPRPPQASHAGTAELLNGYRTTSLIVAAVQLGLPEHLAQGPVSPEPLAERVDADADALVRLLRGLAALGLVEEDDDGHALTDAGAELLPGRPLRDLAVLVGEEYLPAWSRIADGVRTGRPAFPEVFGTGIWEHRERHPHLNDAFNRYLGRSEERAGEAIASVLDLDAARVIVDVGGGLGGVLAGLLRSDPRLEGILVDLPHVIEGATARLDAAGVLDRCRLVAGSFFERIPEGGDIYVLRYILHDWDDERAGAILRRCREAMHERARLVVAESVLPEREPPVWLVMQDLHMLTLLGGRERTEREYESLFRRNGFALRSRASVADTDVLEAVVAGGGA